MKKENHNVVICPPCGENVALATKRGANKENLFLPLLPRLTAVLPPQGREITTRGFTLIELLVVVLIIGILAAVAVPQYKVAVAKSRTSTILPIVSTLQKAEETYYLANGDYTLFIEELDVDIPCTKTLREDNDWPYWKCGNDFLVQASNTGSWASYCPGHNDSYEQCIETRDFQVGYQYIHHAENGKHKCIVRNNSAFGYSICKTLGEQINKDTYLMP